MRLAHLADVHLGFRQYERSNRAGANQREADVAEAFKRAVDGVLEARPDMVLIAGDFFHSVRPTNQAIIHGFVQFQRLRHGLGGSVPIVLVAGDHDTPRSSETGQILGLFRALDVKLAPLEPAVFEFPGFAITAVPKAACRKLGEIRPKDGVRNVLLIHGEARGKGCRPHPDLPYLPRAHGDRDVPAETLEVPWDYIALGHYHVCTRLNARAWYAGSLDYASSDPWGDLREQAALGQPGKGWLLVELGDGEPTVAFQAIQPPRRFLDLEPVDAEGLAAADVDALIASRLAVPELDDACVRLIVRNIDRATQHALAHAAIRKAKARAVNLNVKYERPARESPEPEARQERVRRKMADILSEFLGKRTLPPDMDRERLKALGLEYLEQARLSTDPYDDPYEEFDGGDEGRTDGAGDAAVVGSGGQEGEGGAAREAERGAAAERSPD